MANAKRDDNQVTTMLAVQVDGTLTLPLIDDVTGRVLASISSVASFPAPASQVIERDDNHVHTLAAATSAGVAKAVLIDDTNDSIIATVTVE